MQITRTVPNELAAAYRRLIAIVIAGSTALVAAPAASAVTWSPATTVSGTGVQAYLAPRVAMDANGDTIVAWLKETSDTPGSNCPCVVQAAYRPAGGSFGAPQDVSAVLPTNDSAQQIFLAMGGNGDAIVAWNGGADPNHPGDYDTPYAAIRPVGASSSWGTPAVLDAPSGNNAYPPLLTQLVMDANGDAIAGLSGEQPYTGLGGSAGDQTIDALVVTRSAGHGFDSAHPQILTTGTQTGYLRALGMSPNGHAVAAIRADVNDESHPLVAQPNAVVVMTSASPGAAFANAHTLETVTATKPAGNPSVDTGDITRPDAAIDDAGDYAVEYNENVANGQPFDGFNTTVKVSLNGSAPGTSLNPPGIMSAAANGVLMDPTGQSVALLNETEPLQLMYESVRPAGGVFGAATSLDPSVLAPTAVANASNASGANGEIIYAADKQGTTSQDVDAMIGSAAGVFPPATTLSANDDNFGLGMGAAIDKTGDAAVTWRGGTTGTAVRVALTSSPGGGNPGGGNPGGGNPGGGNPGGGHPGGGGKNPPNTVITKKKVNKHTHSVEFTFKATGPSATGFDCALVKAPKHKSKKRSKPAYKSCESPKTYKHLAHGHYTFYARARNAAGEDKTPATASLRI